MSLWQSTVARAAGVALGAALLAACGSGSTESSAGSGIPGLIKDGEISFCTDPTAPPLEFLDENQKPCPHR